MQKSLAFALSKSNASLRLLLENDTSNPLIKFVDTVFQSLFELILDELALLGPFLKTFCDEVVGKLVEFSIGLFHLVVLGVEDDTLLNLLDILLLEFVVTDRKLFDTEISL